MGSRSGKWSGNRGPRLEPPGPRDKVDRGMLQHPREARHRAKCFIHLTAFHLCGNTEAVIIIPILLGKRRPREVT